MRKLVLMMLLVISIFISNASCQNINTAEQSTSANTVDIKGFSFQPSTLTVPAGTTVTWHNLDNMQHTVSSDTQGLFESGSLDPGEKYAFGFRTPGSYKYHCNIHPGMQGMIVVSATTTEKSSISQQTKSISLPSAIQRGTGSNPTATGSASWSEKPLVMSGQTAAATTAAAAGMATENMQSVPYSTSLQTSSNKASIQALNQSALQQFAQYYRQTSTTPAEQLTAPAEIDIMGEEPAMLYFGSNQKAIPYTQYQNYALMTGSNSLWIRGASSWTQYAIVPQGSTLNMITMSPLGGNGYLYEIYPDGTLDKNSYYFYPYNQVVFYADQIGEHQLFFNIGGQPSNVIVIDVVPYQYQPPVQPSYNYATVTISSNWLRGFDVSVDGVYQTTEGLVSGPVGTVTINVPGNQYHSITITGNGFTFSDYKYFNAGYAYTLNV